MRVSLLHNVIRQFTFPRRCLGKMCSQYFPDLVNRLDERVAKLLILKMRPHSVHDALPELIAALLVNRFVADYREFVRTRRYKNQHSIALARRVHTQLMKLFLCGDEGVDTQFSPLNENADLAGSVCFRFTNRGYDSVMLDFTEKLFGSHFVTSSSQ